MILVRVDFDDYRFVGNNNLLKTLRAYHIPATIYLKPPEQVRGHPEFEGTTHYNDFYEYRALHRLWYKLKHSSQEQYLWQRPIYSFKGFDIGLHLIRNTVEATILHHKALSKVLSSKINSFSVHGDMAYKTLVIDHTKEYEHILQLFHFSSSNLTMADELCWRIGNHYLFHAFYSDSSSWGPSKAHRIRQIEEDKDVVLVVHPSNYENFKDELFELIATCEFGSFEDWIKNNRGTIPEKTVEDLVYAFVQ